MADALDWTALLALIDQHHCDEGVFLDTSYHRRRVARRRSRDEGVRVTPETLAGWMREHWYHSMTRRCACGEVVSPASHPEHIAAAIIARLEGEPRDSR
jgi:hypothetical protein